ncbi:Rieske (2Fe-2S) protein [Novispirillum itersonii]|uniref:Nitrite reductase/ring-hydroxylating ferredoxin subunit n=1 Tax=Novispirillum itersonii TaxID=189 RepID=A0A7X0DM64_NOVIT|nr:Rieske (2Fe-2S) protein [Novispirillum itersonii]MBB6210723.1 nitrite reductase/ring-hydroxylating ferredoxin subunit [Novispirillum itersonii]
MPDPLPDPLTAPRPLFPLDSLRDPGCREVVVETAGDRSGFFVVRQGQTVHAYVNACPHQRVPLNWKPDTFLTPELDAIQCSLHRALFRIEDGYCTEGPCAGRSLTPVPVQVENGMVVVTAPAPSSVP